MRRCIPYGCSPRRFREKEEQANPSPVSRAIGAQPQHPIRVASRTIWRIRGGRSFRLSPGAPLLQLSGRWCSRCSDESRKRHQERIRPGREKGVGAVSKTSDANPSTNRQRGAHRMGCTQAYRCPADSTHRRTVWVTPPRRFGLVARRTHRQPPIPRGLQRFHTVQNPLGSLIRPCAITRLPCRRDDGRLSTRRPHGGTPE